MTEFTASNAIPVTLTDDGRLIVANDEGQYPATIAEGEHVHAIREFFQHERDEELGRWRWPEDSHYVVYGGYSPGEQTRFARVVNEQMGLVCIVYEGHVARSEVHGIAAAYFEAHPESKPWEDAKPGEAWVVKECGQPERAYLVDDQQFYDSSRDYALYFTDTAIIEA